VKRQPPYKNSQEPPLEEVKLPGAASAAAKLARPLIRILKILFTPAALVFLVAVAIKNRLVIQTLLQEARLAPIVLAIALWCCLHLLAALFAMLIFRGAQRPLSFGSALYIHANRLPARYLPGGIWHTVGRIADFRGQGITVRHITLFVFLENALSPCMAFMLGGLFMLAGGGLSGANALLVFAVGLGGIVAVPIIARRWILKGNYSGLPLKNYGVVLALGAAYWCGAAACFTLYFTSFPQALYDGSLWKIGGTYLFSWAIGFITVFAPQGIGIFEAVSGKLLAGAISFGSVAVLAAGFRLVLLTSDLCTFAVVRLFIRKPPVGLNKIPQN
jgi:hypothetical protein